MRGANQSASLRSGRRARINGTKITAVNCRSTTAVNVKMCIHLHGGCEAYCMSVEFLSLVSVLTRDIDIQILSVRLSVCPSVTLWYCI